MTKPQITAQQKEDISVRVLEKYRTSGYPSKARFAKSLDITSSDMSNIELRKWRENDKLIGVQKWLRIARAVGFEFRAARKWVVAETLTYRTITKHLRLCQQDSVSRMFCDDSGIGKTEACKHYAEHHAEAYYIHGGNTPNRWRFVRALARVLGLENEGRAEDVLQECITYLKALRNPLIIVDEAGDLDDSTFLLLKRIYNELEEACGIYLVGGPGLEHKIQKSIRLKKNGFLELFSRMGGRYLRVVPEEVKDRTPFIQAEAKALCLANGLTDPQKVDALLSRVSLGPQRADLRFVRAEVLKHRAAL